MKQKINAIVYMSCFSIGCLNILNTAQMKKIPIIALVLFFVIGQPARAQEEKDFRFTLKTNPLAALGGPLYVLFIPITGEYKILFEAKTTRNQSIEVGTSYLGPSILLNLDQLTDRDSISGVKTSGFRVQLTYKFFLTKEAAPEGFYVGPHVSYASARIRNKDNPDDDFGASKLNMDVLFGYQLITSGGFTLNIYTGLGFKLRDYDFSEGTNFNFDYGNEAAPNVAFGFTFGYAF
jgi:hypothetical protein